MYMVHKPESLPISSKADLKFIILQLYHSGHDARMLVMNTVIPVDL